MTKITFDLYKAGKALKYLVLINKNLHNYICFLKLKMDLTIILRKQSNVRDCICDLGMTSFGLSTCGAETSHFSRCVIFIYFTLCLSYS